MAVRACDRAIGIIFGDIGTSPLYTFANIFQTPPDNDDILAAMSLIFWTLTLVGLIKCAPQLHTSLIP